MNGYPSPSRWTDALWRAAITLAAAALLVNFAHGLLTHSWRFLLVIAVLGLVVSLAVRGVRGRSGW